LNALVCQQVREENHVSVCINPVLNARLPCITFVPSTKENLLYPVVPFHPMALQPKSGLGLYLLLPQCSIINGQVPVATAQKAGSIFFAPQLPIFSWAFQPILLLQT
jgi:hypothetical protein